MATAAVAKQNVASAIQPAGLQRCFQGDSHELLDRLIAACEEKLTRPANPALFGRELQKWCPDAEPSTKGKHPISRRASFNKEHNKRPKPSTSGTSTPRKPNPKQAAPAKATVPKPAPQATTPNKTKRTSSDKFAGPALYTAAPSAASIPLPPASLLTSRPAA